MKVENNSRDFRGFSVQAEVVYQVCYHFTVDRKVYYWRINNGVLGFKRIFRKDKKERRCKMIFLVDRGDWDVVVNSGKKGILIIDKHLFDEEYEWHWVKDIGEKHLLGKVELKNPVMTRISKIDNQQVLAVGFPSRNALKRMLLPFAPQWKKEVDAITVAKFHVIEVERYWCSGCNSVNLEYLKKAIHYNQLPFGCFDCGLEFYTKDLDEGSPRVKNARLQERYCKENIKKIPNDQEGVIAVAGEQ